jgi:hypothetical protein
MLLPFERHIPATHYSLCVCFAAGLDYRPGPRVYRPGLLRHVTHFRHPGIGKCGTCWPSNRFASVAYGKVMKSVRAWWMACVPWVEETDNGAMCFT